MKQPKNTSKDKAIEGTVVKLARALTNLGVMGIEYDDNEIWYRTNGMKVIITVKAEKDRMKVKV